MRSQKKCDSGVRHFKGWKCHPGPREGQDLLFGGWGVGSIFNVFIKHVSFSHCCFKLKAHGRVCLGATWPACSSWAPTTVVLGLVCPRLGEVTINWLSAPGYGESIQTASGGKLFSLARLQTEGVPTPPHAFPSLLTYQRRTPVPLHSVDRRAALRQQNKIVPPTQ